MTLLIFVFLVVLIAGVPVFIALAASKGITEAEIWERIRPDFSGEDAATHDHRIR